MKKTSALLQEDCVVVFSYAPAGLGHLRVVTALRRGLPNETNITLLGSHDQSMRFLHRITTTHPIEKFIADWFQTGPLADFFAGWYKAFLKWHSKFLYDQLTTIIEQRLNTPKKVVVVATHFGLAHQLVAVKKRIEQEKEIKIYLVVQVTDDTFQPMWHVEGADLLFVPSEFTKERFRQYEKKKKLAPLDMRYEAYPVNPDFFVKLSNQEIDARLDQLTVGKKEAIHVAIPVSGAAVGTQFHYGLIKTLSRINDRFKFQIIARQASFTKRFLGSLVRFSNVNVFSSEKEKAIIDYYDTMFAKEVFSLEITKPSEMTYKALVPPNAQGGVILLFMQPIGRQEEDNLRFLQRHKLIPTDEEQDVLWSCAKRKLTLTPEEVKKFRYWRGLRLPLNARQAAKFITWCLDNNLFVEMLKYKVSRIDDFTETELNEQGVANFWTAVEKLVS